MTRRLEVVRICSRLRNLLGASALPCTVMHSGPGSLDLAMDSPGIENNCLMLVSDGLYLGPMGAVVRGTLPILAPGTRVFVSAGSAQISAELCTWHVPPVRFHFDGIDEAVAMNLRLESFFPNSSDPRLTVEPSGSGCFSSVDRFSWIFDRGAVENLLAPLVEAMDGECAALDELSDPAAVSRTAVSRIAVSRVADFLELVGKGGSREELAVAARAIAGLGPGLTPAGDDLLAGVMLCGLALSVDIRSAEGKTAAANDKSPIAAVIADCAMVSALAPELAALTSWLSGQMLIEAGRGYFPEPILALGRALADRSFEELVFRLAGMRDYGHSSGPAIALGALWCLAAASGEAVGVDGTFRRILDRVFQG